MFCFVSLSKIDMARRWSLLLSKTLTTKLDVLFVRRPQKLRRTPGCSVCMSKMKTTNSKCSVFLSLSKNEIFEGACLVFLSKTLKASSHVLSLVFSQKLAMSWQCPGLLFKIGIQNADVLSLCLCQNMQQERWCPVLLLKISGISACSVFSIENAQSRAKAVNILSLRLCQNELEAAACLGCSEV